MPMNFRFILYQLGCLLGIVSITANADTAYLQTFQNPMEFTENGVRFGLVAVDTETASVLASLDLGFTTVSPRVAITVSADGGKVYVSNQHEVTVIDAHRFLPTRTFHFDSMTQQVFALSGNELLLNSGGKIIRVDAGSGDILDQISLPVTATRFIINRSSSHLYGRAPGLSGIMIIKTAQLEDQRMIDVIDRGPIFGLSLTPDENHILLRNFNVGEPTRLRKIDLDSGEDVWFEDDLPGLKLPAGSLNTIATDYVRGVNILYNSPISTNDKLLTIDHENGSLATLWELPPGISAVSSNMVVSDDTLLLSLFNNGCPGGPVCGLSGNYLYGNLAENEFISSSQNFNDPVVYHAVGSRIIGEDKLIRVSVPTLSMGGLAALLLLLSVIVYHRLGTGWRNRF